MAITKSAKKALRQSLRRKEINSQQKRKIKNFLKKVRSLGLEKKNEEAKKFLPELYKMLDKAAKSNLIKKNRADRIKSRISLLLNKKN